MFLINIEYISVFEYYDLPLAFVFKWDGRVFLAYAIEENDYLIKELDIDDAVALRDHQDVRKLLEEYIEKGMGVYSFKDELTYFEYSVEEYLQNKKYELSDILPEIEYKFNNSMDTYLEIKDLIEANYETED